MIDRYQLVNRNSPVLEKIDSGSPFTVGNGDFAFTADITGLQTFYQEYADCIPLNTMAQWGWHSFVDTKYKREDLKLKVYKRGSKLIPFASDAGGQEELFRYLRENPHKYNLGRIGFYSQINGPRLSLSDIELVRQKLDLWQGILFSDFNIAGKNVKVKTVCDPLTDSIAVRVKTGLFLERKLGLEIEFPYPAVDKTASDWDNKKGHRTIWRKLDDKSYSFSRFIDKEYYFMNVYSSEKLQLERHDEHRFVFIVDSDKDEISFVCNFSRELLRNQKLEYQEIERRSIEYWNNYWKKGGMIDFSGTADSRARELERRVVLSQYLTAIQCAGTLPPAETGLTANSWYGKFHLEMHFWHAAHFVLWNREALLEKSLWWYYRILDVAKELARSQGFEGVRWPKMVGPEGYDSPSAIGPFLVWQQPHPIIYAELLYRNKKSKAILENYYELVAESAKFMESYLEYEEEKDRYNLAAPLIPAQECFNERACLNPTFELEYWYTAFLIAQKWRERLGMERNEKWEEIINKLADLPQKNNLYLAHEKAENTFEQHNIDHPSMLAAFGLLPGYKVDKRIMENTLNKVLEVWQFEETWGWDFPVMAMTAARLGKKDLAVDLLLMDSPKNTYLINGHNKQADKEDLPLYLPGNGALLLATGMMAAGWDNSPDEGHFFPNDWQVEFESISKYL